MTKKKTVQIAIRLDDDENEMLLAVQEHIAACSRGMRPDLAEIIRSLIGWGNPDLVSPEERAYLRGELKSLDPGEPKKAAGSDVLLSSGRHLGENRRRR